MKTKSRMLVSLGVSMIALTACGADEATRDTPIAGVDDKPAYVGSMPDGYSNWARKCDGPNMVYTIYRSLGNNVFGAIDVVPNDPRCL